MELAVGMNAFDIYRTGREQFFWQTFNSIKDEEPEHLLLYSNGSTDGTGELVERLGGIFIRDRNEASFGIQDLITRLVATTAPLILFSADDIGYTSGWLPRLKAFLEAMPPEIRIVTPLWEWDYDWNKPYKVVEYGGERAVFRASLPGSCWAFRAMDWNMIGPIPQKRFRESGEDLETCARLRNAGYHLAALPLGEHLGQEKSAWNATPSWSGYGKILSKEILSTLGSLPSTA